MDFPGAKRIDPETDRSCHKRGQTKRQVERERDMETAPQADRQGSRKHKDTK